MEGRAGAMEGRAGHDMLRKLGFEPLRAVMSSAWAIACIDSRQGTQRFSPAFC